jgi:lambda family phage portal protein
MGLRTWFAETFMGRPKASFDAARRGRLTIDFFTPETSADAEIKGSLKALRNSARALARDNSHARAIKRTYRINVFGSRGIKLQPQIKQIESGELDTLRNGIVNTEWKLWCRADSCDVAGINTFHGMELDIGSALTDSGELFFRIVRGRRFGRSRVPFALEVIEADHLDEDCNEASEIPGRHWRMGIERDEWNRPTRYRFLKRHPGDYELSRVLRDNEKYVTLNAADVIHVYGVRERVGQTRMEPVLTPVVMSAWNLQQYQKSHLVKKRVQSSQLGFIQTPEGFFQPDDTDSSGRKIINSEPGQYRELDPGQVAIPPDFGPDDGQYETVVKTHLRDHAAGTGTSYATISKDYSDANYSSLKISTSEDRDWWRVLQTAIIEQFHQRVYEEWLYTAVMYGVFPVATFSDYWYRPERYTMPKWQARAWGLLDPAKETKAMREERALQIKTHTQQIMEYTGEEFEEVLERIKYEMDYKDDRDLLMSIDNPESDIPVPCPEPTTSGDQPERAV